MATPEQIRKILELAESITAAPINDLVSQQKWGVISFENARRDLDLIFVLCNHLKELPLEILPGGVSDVFASKLNEVNTVIGRIQKFSIESGNPTGQRDEIIGQVHVYAEQLLTTTQAWIPFLAYQKGDIQKNIEALSNAVLDANKILDQAKRDSGEKSTELAGIITAAREASASAGVGVFTLDFSEKAGALDDEAGKWLIATAVLAGVTLLCAVGSFFLAFDKDASNPQVIQFITSKVITLVVLLTATIWCGRVYKATKHQSAMNSHRANALKTFQAFVKAGSDDATRNAVLLETTRSIFAISPTGYLESADSATDGGTKVLEIVKSATSNSK